MFLFLEFINQRGHKLSGECRRQKSETSRLFTIVSSFIILPSPFPVSASWHT
jgi:ABC-type lipopolysaccharide export system ATPase subunit